MPAHLSENTKSSQVFVHERQHPSLGVILVPVEYWKDGPHLELEWHLLEVAEGVLEDGKPD